MQAEGHALSLSPFCFFFNPRTRACKSDKLITSPDMGFQGNAQDFIFVPNNLHPPSSRHCYKKGLGEFGSSTLIESVSLNK